MSSLPSSVDVRHLEVEHPRRRVPCGDLGTLGLGTSRRAPVVLEDGDVPQSIRTIAPVAWIRPEGSISLVDHEIIRTVTVEIPDIDVDVVVEARRTQLHETSWRTSRYRVVH